MTKPHEEAYWVIWDAIQVPRTDVATELVETAHFYCKHKPKRLLDVLKLITKTEIGSKPESWLEFLITVAFEVPWLRRLKGRKLYTSLGSKEFFWRFLGWKHDDILLTLGVLIWEALKGVKSYDGGSTDLLTCVPSRWSLNGYETSYELRPNLPLRNGVNLRGCSGPNPIQVDYNKIEMRMAKKINAYSHSKWDRRLVNDVENILDQGFGVKTQATAFELQQIFDLQTAGSDKSYDELLSFVRARNREVVEGARQVGQKIHSSITPSPPIVISSEEAEERLGYLLKAHELGHISDSTLLRESKEIAKQKGAGRSQSGSWYSGTPHPVDSIGSLTFKKMVEKINKPVFTASQKSSPNIQNFPPKKKAALLDHKAAPDYGTPLWSEHLREITADQYLSSGFKNEFLGAPPNIDTLKGVKADAVVIDDLPKETKVLQKTYDSLVCEGKEEEVKEAMEKIMACENYPASIDLGKGESKTVTTTVDGDGNLIDVEEK
jgi:hypothetical protein